MPCRHYPLQQNFRPSASQALHKALKRGRLEKLGGKYRLNPCWGGGPTVRIFYAPFSCPSLLLSHYLRKTCSKAQSLNTLVPSSRPQNARPDALQPTVRSHRPHHIRTFHQDSPQPRRHLCMHMGTHHTCTRCTLTSLHSRHIHTIRHTIPTVQDGM